MARSPRYSKQTVSVLGALCADPSQWQHGYELAKQTGLKSGTLYPILIRLADRGLVEACWEHEQPAGRPRRHLYRLSGAGLEQARAVVATARSTAAVAARRGSTRRGAAAGPRRLAGQGS